MTHTARPTSSSRHVAAAAIVLAIAAGTFTTRAQDAQGSRFTSGVELVNVTATVTDDNGRFVPSLTKDDFAVFENGRRQSISHFSHDRAPVSLGLAVDASGSMTADKMAAARTAIDRFVYDLLGPEDELFFIEFSSSARLTQTWTSDRAAISRAVGRVRPEGGTALYDAIDRALPVAATGRHRKKAVLVLSDGNDTNSSIGVALLRQRIRESEVLVYALGVDGALRDEPRRQRPQVGFPVPNPFPQPQGRGRVPFPQPGGGPWTRSSGERVNGDALREVTDDTGGRTEIVRGFGDLPSATARLADELSKQYSLAYTSTEERDGKWHPIRVEVRDRRLTVRARRGYVAS